ncbi:MAG: pyridoxamine 5'-phosphate oxidase family protein [Clostridia bacterium]|nr:pyridoxamine 5'-phosphate oxidase family protein [Clostridia bacterium]
MRKTKFAVLILALMLISTSVTVYADTAEDTDMTNLEFFESLNFDDGLSVVVDVFERFPLQYATTLGKDGNPQIRPIEFKFEEDGVLYFDTVVFYASYAEMLAHPYIQLCVCDQETMTYVRLGGKVNFTKDQDIINRCFEESPVLTSQFGNMREFVIGYYLTEVWAEFTSFSSELPKMTYSLSNKYDVNTQD